MCIFPAMKGVCDTPLHLFDQFMGNTMVEHRAFSPMWGPYAIRPYSFGVKSSSYNGWNAKRCCATYTVTGVGTLKADIVQIPR